MGTANHRGVLPVPVLFPYMVTANLWGKEELLCVVGSEGHLRPSPGIATHRWWPEPVLIAGRAAHALLASIRNVVTPTLNSAASPCEDRPDRNGTARSFGLGIPAS